MKKTFFYLLFCLATGLILTSCEDNVDDLSQTDKDNYATNKWILSEMQTYYYWTDMIPSNPKMTADPESFFESLLNKTDDRFSWIQNATELQNSLNGVTKSTGFEMKLYKMSDASNNLIGQVLYVFPNTPASRAGVKRGDLFTKINGTTLTVSNYVDLLFGANSSTLNIGFVNKEFVDVKTTQIVTAEIIENPIMLDSVYTINGKKIGYFAYKNFIPDPGDSSLVYDNKMNAIFGKFKSEGINELVLDLRLNTGGSVSSAIKLASLIVHGATQNDILLHSKYNTLLTNELRNYKGESAFYEKFNSAANNVGSTISRLVVLTGKHTASASELIINGLRPYMQVITVGDTTYGKNVGSITITDDSKKITWGLQPIIVKLFNKNNESDYTHGFVPTIYDADNKLVLYQFGDLREPLLREAITQVYGIPLDNVAPLKAKQKSSLGREVGNSLAHHPGAYSTIMNR